MICDDIFAWAARTPEKVAAVADGQPLTYRGFADRIARARGGLAAAGWTGSGVAVVVIRTILDCWITTLALRSLGFTTLAVGAVNDLAHVQASGLRLVAALAEEALPGLAEVCAARALPLALLGRDGGAQLGLHAYPPPCGPGGHILQTSGTTGTYKKVLIHPSFEAGFLQQRLDLAGASSGTVIDLFDFALWTGGGYKSAAAAWMVGGTVIVDQRPDRHLSLRYPGITMALMVPSMLDALLAEPEGAFPRSETLQLSITGGALTQARIDAAKARITPHLFSGLGATETLTYGLTPLNTPEDQIWHRLVPGVAVELVDEADRPAPVGAIGRVRVGTAGGPTSYLDDAAATREFFRDGFFYPGDLAVMRADGRISLQGRVTDVINAGGHKISPAPIEHRLREALGVSDVCLFSMPNAAGTEVIHVVVEGAAQLDVARLTAALRAELWGFPSAEVHQLALLPRNEAGKVLRVETRAQVLARRG